MIVKQLLSLPLLTLSLRFLVPLPAMQLLPPHYCKFSFHFRSIHRVPFLLHGVSLLPTDVFYCCLQFSLLQRNLMPILCVADVCFSYSTKPRFGARFIWASDIIVRSAISLSLVTSLSQE